MWNDQEFNFTHLGNLKLQKVLLLEPVLNTCRVPHTFTTHMQKIRKLATCVIKFVHYCVRPSFKSDFLKQVNCLHFFVDSRLDCLKGPQDAILFLFLYFFHCFMYILWPCLLNHMLCGLLSFDLLKRPQRSSIYFFSIGLLNIW